MAMLILVKMSSTLGISLPLHNGLGLYLVPLFNSQHKLRDRFLQDSD